MYEDHPSEAAIAYLDSERVCQYMYKYKLHHIFSFENSNVLVIALIYRIYSLHKMPYKCIKSTICENTLYLSMFHVGKLEYRKC